MTGIKRIAAERQRQIDRKGYDAVHDDEHTEGQIADAAVAYLQSDTFPWPWDGEPKVAGITWDFEPEQIPQRIRELEKAGALAAAEIDRLLRMEAHDE